MRILIAPDKFKGSLGAEAAGQSIAAGLQSVLPEAELEIVALADGGEGTAAAICRAASGEMFHCRVHDALGREITAPYAWLPESRLVICEMSAAAGLAQLVPNDRDPLRASTFGVGELLRAALARDPREIVIGLGGARRTTAASGSRARSGFASSAVTTLRWPGRSTSCSISSGSSYLTSSRCRRSRPPAT